MGNRFASGKRSIAMCDICGQQYKLKQLKEEVVKTKRYNLLVCPECWSPDHPQLQLGMYPVDDPQAVRNPRRDSTYQTAGTNSLEINIANPEQGFPTGGSRDIQWGWSPVGGARANDVGLTPNYLVATTSVGSVSVQTT
jgi:hypothetical protein